MNAVEEIQAAIDKLTKLKARSTRGTWEVDDNRPFSSELQGIFVPDVRKYSIKFDWDEQPKRADADLIVTLHRTIDAQLAILNDFIERYGMRRADDWEPIAPAARNALTLARAINGGTN